MATLPVLIGIVGEGRCEGSVWRSSLQQKVRELLNDYKKEHPFTPLLILCNCRNDLERAVFEAAMQQASRHMELAEPTFESYAKHSQILICVRSDEDQSIDRLIEIRVGMGGQISDLAGLLYHRERGPVWELSCSGERVDVRKIYPKHPSDDAGEFESLKAAGVPNSRRYDSICKNIDRFNQDIDNIEISDKTSPLLSENEKQKLSESHSILLQQFEICDRLASYHQKRTYALYVAIFLFSFAVVFFHDIYGNLVPGAPLRPELYLASFLLAFLTYWIGKKRDYENKYLDYRALAEGMRVQFFWSLMDLPLAVADHYLHKCEDELMWIRRALRTWHFTGLQKEQSCSLAAAERLQIITMRWIRDQSHYFGWAGLSNKKQLKILRFGSTGLLYIAGALAVLRIFIRTQHVWILAATGMAAAIGALIKGYIQRRGLSEHLKQYSRMAELYMLAQNHAESLWNGGDAVALIQELGKESLAENAEWILLHRDRRVSFPNLK